MDVEAFLICDAATDQLGKLNVLGAFDAIMAKAAPVILPQFAVALRLRFQKSESANHPFRINIINEDGKSIMVKPIDGNLNIQIQQADESIVINLIGNFPKSIIDLVKLIGQFLNCSFSSINPAIKFKLCAFLFHFCQVS